MWLNQQNIFIQPIHLLWLYLHQQVTVQVVLVAKFVVLTVNLVEIVAFQTIIPATSHQAVLAMVESIFNASSVKTQSRLTKRAADGGDSARFTSIFLALGLYCSQSFIYTRPPSAANANRWHASPDKTDFSTMILIASFP